MKTPSPIQHDTTPDTRARLTQYELPTAATIALTQTPDTPRAGLITLTEQAALSAVDAVEAIREPITPERIAKAAILTAATLARAWRGHTSDR